MPINDIILPEAIGICHTLCGRVLNRSTARRGQSLPQQVLTGMFCTVCTVDSKLMAPAEFWTCLKVSSPSLFPALYAQLELQTLFVGGRL